MACPVPLFLREVDAFCVSFSNCWSTVTGEDVARGGEGVTAPLIPSKEIL